MKEDMEFKPKGILKTLDKQDAGPYLRCEGVDELLRAYPGQFSRISAMQMFLLGYIEGKRAERARRSKTLGTHPKKI